MKSIVRNKNTKGIIVITDRLKERILSDYPELNKNKIATFPDGADLCDLDANTLKEYKETINAFGYGVNIGYTGTAGEGRGLDLICYLASKLPKVAFHIVGMVESDFYMFVGKINPHPENIIFHGFKNSSSIPYFISSFDLMLAPYQKKVIIKGSDRRAKETDTGQWMSPIKIFEYMASGTPFITSDLAVLREVLDENNSSLVAPEISSLWQEEIERFLLSPEIFKRKAIKAKTQLEDMYTWDARALGIKNKFMV